MAIYIYIILCICILNVIVQYYCKVITLWRLFLSVIKVFRVMSPKNHKQSIWSNNQVYRCSRSKCRTWSFLQRENFAKWKDIPSQCECHQDVLWGPQSHLQPDHQTHWVAPSAPHFLSCAPPAERVMGDEKARGRMTGRKWQTLNLDNWENCFLQHYERVSASQQERHQGWERLKEKDFANVYIEESLCEKFKCLLYHQLFSESQS